jgi:hypothetical protein
MIRLHAVVEGQTEETFVRDVLAPKLGEWSVFIDSRCVMTGRHRGVTYRGGITKYQKLRTDLVLWMKEDQQPEAWFTTMFDLYAMPDDFPGYRDCARLGDPVQRVECLEDRLLDDVAHRRFIPYVQLHEFEALIFSDPRQLEGSFPGNPGAIDQLITIRGEFPTPEHINDRPELAPSKRILRVLPDYRKPVAGPTILKQIGLATLRRQCPHFNRWIERIRMAASQ